MIGFLSKVLSFKWIKCRFWPGKDLSTMNFLAVIFLNYCSKNYLKLLCYFGGQKLLLV